MDRNWRKLLLTREDLKRITTKTINERVRKSKKYPDGIKPVQIYLVDGYHVKGGMKQAEDALKEKIWKEKQKAEFKKNHGGMFK